MALRDVLGSLVVVVAHVQLMVNLPLVVEAVILKAILPIIIVRMVQIKVMLH